MNLKETLAHLFHPRRSNNHRPKFLHHKPLLFLTVLTIGFYQAVSLVSTLELESGSILGYASNINSSQVIQQTNQIRRERGLAELTHNTLLSQAALAKAQNMFTDQYWAHTSPTGKEPWDFMKQSGYTYKVAGENLARDFDVTPNMMNAWMNSPTHKANIINPRYREIGISVIDGKLNGVETTLVVQMFGTPSLGQANPSIEVPAVSTEELAVEGAEQVLPSVSGTDLGTTGVLSKSLVPQGNLKGGALYSPQLVLKAVFLSIIIFLLAVLIYDAFVTGHKNSVRLVSKNLAHIILLLFVGYLVIVFRVGVVGS